MTIAFFEDHVHIFGGSYLILDQEGRLVLCQHGDRRLARMNASLTTPDTSFVTIVDQYENKRFNSPNDVVQSSSGDYYFTDPPYGLAGQDEDSLKEQAHNGVYKLSTDGTLTLLTDELTRPNGITLSPDEKTLYVANSDPDMALWMAYDLTEEGIENGRVLLDVTDMIGELRKGLPDGLKVNDDGVLFATGPGGVLVITPEGKHIGTIMTEFKTANCAFNSDKTALYMTTDDYLTRLKF